MSVDREEAKPELPGTSACRDGAEELIAETAKGTLDGRMTSMQRWLHGHTACAGP